MNTISRPLQTMGTCLIVMLLGACSSGQTDSAQVVEKSDHTSASVSLPNNQVQDSPKVEDPGKRLHGNKPHGQIDPHLNLAPEKYGMVALGHLDEGRISEALETINNAIKAHPESGHVFAIRSQIYAAQNQSALALSDLEQAVTLEPDNPLHYVSRAAVYSKFDRDDQALADLDTAVSLDSDLLAARFNRGSLRFVRDDLNGALEDFEHCIAVDPHTPAPYFNRAAVLDAQGKRNLAIADLERFVQLATNESWKEAAQNLLNSWEHAETAQAEQAVQTNG